jgi:hypothetical protein
MMPAHDPVAAGAAMRDQARHWDAVADAMARTHARFAQLSLSAAAFTVGGPPTEPAAAGLATAYAARHDRLTALFRQATEEFDRMAEALRVTAEEYDETDRAAAGRLRELW